MSDSCNGKLGAFYPVPFGLGKKKPKHFREMFQIVWENRDNLRYACRILNHGVCDGCSLGPRVLKDDVMEGTHLCLTRLNLLRLNTMPAMAPGQWTDVERLRQLSNRQLHDLGRLSKPLVRRRGDRGFRAVGWDEAYRTIADAIHATSPDRVGFFVTSRGITNETYLPRSETAPHDRHEPRRPLLLALRCCHRCRPEEHDRCGGPHLFAQRHDRD